MKTIAIVSQKGGAGKTTLALHLAVAAELAGCPAAVLDMDPQGTAEAWAEWRGDEIAPVVTAAKAPTLARMLQKAEAAGAGVVIIDTPPLAEAEARAAAKLSDLVLIPCRPRAFDLHAIQATADLVKSVGTPAFVILNAGPSVAPKLYAETTEIVQQIGLTVAPARITERAAFHQSTGSGQTAQEIERGGKAAAEIEAVWRWISQQAGMMTSKRVNTPAEAQA